jgi:phospholipid/cholesterol/gamma-HCH transport system substrate-binding protein
VRADPIVVRRITGTASVILLVGLAAIGLDARFTTTGAYEVEAELGRAGAGLRQGTDVKVRGVNVGQVTEVRISDEGEATATLELEPDPPLPADVRPVVSPKTFLGEKQIELVVDGPLTEPFLAAGDRLRARDEDQPIEPVTVVDQIGHLLAEIDDDKLAAFFEALAAFDRDDAELFARGIDTGAELSEFLARTGPDQVERMGQAAAAFDALAAAGDDLTRVSRALPDAAAPLVEHQEQLRVALASITDFSATLGTFLRVEEPTISAALQVGDRIGAVVDPRLGEIGTMIHGIYRYSLMFGQQGGELTDGSEFALFRAFLGDAGQLAELCGQLPDELAAVAPGCLPGGGGP